MENDEDSEPEPISAQEARETSAEINCRHSGSVSESTQSEGKQRADGWKQQGAFQVEIRFRLSERTRFFFDWISNGLFSK